MPKIEAFERHSRDYDDWYTRHPDIYQAELNAIKTQIPEEGCGLEIGVGTGRFAAPLRIKMGVDPSKNMAEIARERGIEVHEGFAEELPFDDGSFDFILMVTTVCFVDDLLKTFKEAHRVLVDDGHIIIGFIDKESDMGKRYQLKKDGSKFYKDANFRSVEEVIDALRLASIKDVAIKQTVFPGESNREYTIENGHGKGSFVVVKGRK